jgi:phenylacetic acid degradation operon negative regulatory protein
MLTDSTHSPAQHLLITLLSDYQEIAGLIPSGLLVEVLGDLGVSSDAARTALSRLVRSGLIVRSKIGRSTAYQLSALGKQEVADSIERILSFGEPQPWDERWTLVAFSVSGDNDRQLRHQLRSRLRVHGFSPIYDGLWAAREASVDQAKALVKGLVVNDISFFRGTVEFSEPLKARLLASREIDSLRSDYEMFIETFGPLQKRIMRDEVSPSESLIARTRLLDAWRTFPGRDPDLSEEFLGADWPRGCAREIFIQCFRDLAPTAELRLKTLLKAYAGGE